ncbi:hypothetical protein [Solemya velum gill symbiont]|uniref:hypothetical protein n=1 Tax=Solemya velum gill symbiont TaxID=2340 RepID=UPI001179E1D9|nr:hypothetical protein [Solemya velum gill symbiont]
MRTTITALLITLLLVPLQLQAGSLDDQRKTFLAAEKAWQEDDTESYEKLKSSLGDYPLRLYLDYAELKKRFGKADNKEIENFIEANRDRIQRSILVQTSSASNSQP